MKYSKIEQTVKDTAEAMTFITKLKKEGHDVESYEVKGIASCS